VAGDRRWIYHDDVHAYGAINQSGVGTDDLRSVTDQPVPAIWLSEREASSADAASADVAWEDRAWETVLADGLD
jgi:hypothetical protein